MCEPSSIHAFCSADIRGYQAFAARKSVLRRLLACAPTSSCYRVDDTFVETCATQLGIPIARVPYHGDTSWMCSFDRTRTDTHPRLTELAHDDRGAMTRTCARDVEDNLAQSGMLGRSWFTVKNAPSNKT